MSLPTTCPNCKRALKDTAKPHCMEQRRTPCGWVTCDPKGCHTVIDGRGNYYPHRDEVATS